ncbi:MAG: hypothetical protein JO292_12175 [Betaproteobacteria bacterium]|nr:hypothetical protein [Betaproteobacteria bacterium]MBV9362136.1 hypothetical protein [Betaproteobacteria bacterium]
MRVEVHVRVLVDGDHVALHVGDPAAHARRGLRRNRGCGEEKDEREATAAA